MKTLLRIDSSPRAERSQSRRLTALFAQAWSRAHPESTIIHRDLALVPVPFVNEDWIAAAYSDPAGHTPAQRSAIAVSDQLVDELLAADEMVIGTPMFNFSVSASLKAWIDQVVRIGRTIQFPDYAPLVHGRKATIIATRGGAGLGPGEPLAQFDGQVPYLKQILRFIGITDVSVVYVGCMNDSQAARQSSLDRAITQIHQLAST
jgi:FMN-dependent NADH-azoreductase